MEEIDKSQIDKQKDVAYIVVGRSQWKIKERHFSEEYAIGKYIRWDASEKTWKKNMERLKWLLSQNNPKYKDVKVLKLMIAEHGNHFGYYDPKKGFGTKIKKRFQEVVQIIKENFLDTNKERKLYFKTSSCYGAFCILPDESEFGDDWKSKDKTWREKDLEQRQEYNCRIGYDNVFYILANFFTDKDDIPDFLGKLDDKYKNRIWCTNVVPNDSVNAFVPVPGIKKPFFFTMKKSKNMPGLCEYIKQYIKYLFSKKDAKTFVTDWLIEQQRAHPEWNIKFGSDRKVYFSLDDYLGLNKKLKSLLHFYNYWEEQQNRLNWEPYMHKQAKNKKNECIYDYVRKNVTNKNNINYRINTNDNEIGN